VSTYICGDGFTAADCMVGFAVRWAQSYGLCIGSPFDAYLELLRARPAFQLAFDDAKNVDLRPRELGAVAALVTG
jgi:glutathione S-transferase